MGAVALFYSGRLFDSLKTFALSVHELLYHSGSPAGVFLSVSCVSDPGATMAPNDPGGR